jgi:hypothetical protein
MMLLKRYQGQLKRPERAWALNLGWYKLQAKYPPAVTKPASRNQLIRFQVAVVILPARIK